MDQGTRVITRGYYALARYQPDRARGEFRNVAVLFVDEAGTFTGLRSLRPSSISRSLEEHGLVARLMEGVQQRLASSPVGIDQLRELTDSFSHSIVFSEPKPAIAEGSPRDLLESLFVALVAPRHRLSVGFTKAHVLDRLARWVKARGGMLDIGAEEGGFTFDGVLRHANKVVYAMHVTSFATRQLNARKLEQEVGHFLFAASHVDERCVAVVQPALSSCSPETRRSQEKVTTWLADAGVRAVTPTTLRTVLSSEFMPQASRPTQLELASPIFS